MTVAREEEIIAMTSTNTPYVETDKEVVKCSFRLLGFVNSTFVGEGSKVLVPRVSKSSLIEVSEILGKGSQVGKGLGKNLQRRTKVV